jgi:hypothetical protein
MAGLTPENFAQKAFERSDCGSFQNGNLSLQQWWNAQLIRGFIGGRWRSW